MAKILLSDPWAAISGSTSSDDKVVFRPSPSPPSVLSVIRVICSELEVSVIPPESSNFAA